MSAAYQHVNRRGDVYYLQAKDGKSGQPKYSFARKVTGKSVPQLPNGFEVREHPETGQVVIRRFKPRPIRPEEKQLLEDTIRKQTKGLLFIVDVEDRSLVVYISEMNVETAEARVNALRQIAPMDEATARGIKADMLANASYAKMMRFTLIEAGKRLFNMDRCCFKGSIDDWYFIEGDAPLPVLAENYVRHLGQESFFDLM